MKRDYKPEDYNYNKYPGQQFINFEDKVKSDEVELTIVENSAADFDVEAFTQRFSEILLKYDYIVGDWGNEQLRLKGFYEESGEQIKLNKIQHLQDYLKEYCNFGCDYFVLRNDNPKEVVFEEETFARKRRKKSRTHQKSRPAMRERDDFVAIEKIPKKKTRHRRPQSQKSKDFSGDRSHFTIRQKG